MDAISTQRLAACHPALIEKVTAALAECSAQGVYVRITSGLRNYAEQDQIFFMCHHADGTLDATKPWTTNARGGYSNHNFGMAVDCIPSLGGINDKYNPDLNGTRKAAWTIMVAAMKAQGLAWGGDWTKKDNDHFQLANVPVTPNDHDRMLYASGGMASVWGFYGDDLGASKPGDGTVVA